MCVFECVRRHRLDKVPWGTNNFFERIRMNILVTHCQNGAMLKSVGNLISVVSSLFIRLGTRIGYR